MIKMAMINVQRELKAARLNTKMILQVHDELVFDVPRGEEEKVKSLVEEQMKNAMSLDVPILVESGTGTNWLEAHSCIGLRFCPFSLQSRSFHAYFYKVQDILFCKKLSRIGQFFIYCHRIQHT